MKPVFWQSKVYMFLYMCEYYNVDKTVLDCGAGGHRPPLYLFHEHDYKVTGIDISDESLRLSNEFQKEQNLDLKINKGDMRHIEYDDESFGCVYSYNTIFHMMKNEVKESIKEMKRVLKTNGLMYFNLLSTKSDGLSMGEDVGNNEIKQEEHGELILHSYYDDNEIDSYLTSIGLKIIRKTIRTLQTPDSGDFQSAYIDYTVLKDD